ncbi:methionine--tRNA ligase, mitochondrial [Macrobrachium rosenbergii]|uniref:methionine--tRNA ligase, mitochondrial n=1 Tax=Macrobrachium rosenbergii TaxID=79674 RepID=UPI0034D52997
MFNRVAVSGLGGILRPTIHRTWKPLPCSVCLAKRWSSVCSERKYFITTPIFYVNAQPHIGHLHSALLADASHRFQFLKYKNGLKKTLFSTGTDEHGLKVQQSAANKGVHPLEFCNEISQKFRNLFDAANIGYTHYVRTVEERHVNAVHHFFQTIVDRGHIYQGAYSGWYCISDEAYLTDVQVKEITLQSGIKQFISIESGHPVEWNSEENYMFRLSGFQEDLKYWLKDDCRVQPKRFLEELRKWLEDDLKDLSVSRPKDRVSWGISVPNDENHNIYVWVDALVNYLTVAGFPNLTSWPPDVQVLGKDILRFHGIYWPALLMAADLEPPNKLLCHSHWTVDGQKMSKSIGNIVCPYNCIEAYSSDGLRYFLLREGTPHSDNNWSDVRVARLLNAELANSLGNLLNRCTAPSLNPSQEFPSLNLQYLQNMSAAGKELIELVHNLPKEVENHYDNFNFYRAVDVIMTVVHSANNFVQEEKPWELKTLTDRTKLDSILRITLETVRVVGIALLPITPILANKLLNSIGVMQQNRYWECIENVFSKANEKYLSSSFKLGSRTKLFTKLKV